MARPKGSKNKAKTGRKGTKRATRRPNRPQNRLIVSEMQAGGNDDPVLHGFAQKEEQLRQRLEEQLQGIEAARNAYIASTDSRSTEHTTPPLEVRITRTGTPDMRTKAGRQYMETHPGGIAGGVAPRGD